MGRPAHVAGRTRAPQRPTQLSDTPVHRGAIFWSPYCGRGCTLAAHNKAQQNATALCLAHGGVANDLLRDLPNIGGRALAPAAGSRR